MSRERLGPALTTKAVRVSACMLPLSVKASKLCAFRENVSTASSSNGQTFRRSPANKDCIQRHYRIRGHWCRRGNKLQAPEDEASVAARAPSTGPRSRPPNALVAITDARWAAPRREQLLRAVPSEGGRSNGARSLFFGSICHAAMAFGAAGAYEPGTTCACGVSLPMFAPLAST